MKNIVDIFTTEIINFGTVGKITELVDNKGNTLYVGDIVEIITPSGSKYTTIIVEDESYPFAMGWKCYQTFDDIGEVNLIQGHGGLTSEHPVMKDWEFEVMSEELMKLKIKEFAELNNVVDNIKSEIAKVSTLDELKEVLSKYSNELM